MEQVTGRGFGRSWGRGRGRAYTLPLPNALFQREVLFWAEVLSRLDKILDNYSKLGS